jgi:hypothetical protein
MKKHTLKKYLPAVYFLVIVFAIFFIVPHSAHAIVQEPIRITVKSPLVPNQEGIVKVYLAHYSFQPMSSWTTSLNTVFVFTPTTGVVGISFDCEEVNTTTIFEVWGSHSYPLGTTFWTCTGKASFSTPGSYSVKANYKFGVNGLRNDEGTTESKTITVVDGTLPDPSIYHFLAPVGCDPGTPGCVDRQLVTFDPSQKNALSTYLNIFIKILIGIAAVLAVVMIVMGGIQYMTSELVSGKAEGKKRIMDALIGLLLALAAVILLKTINPSLLSVEPNIGEVSLTDYSDTPEGNATLSPISISALQNYGHGIFCPGYGGITSTGQVNGALLVQIAKTFEKNVTYDNDKRFTINNSIPTIYLDCSAFVDQVYACAGLSNPGGNTTGIFSSKTPLNVSGLKVGDLVGWTAADYGTKMGHVLMFIGSGQYINTPGKSTTGVNTAVRTTSSLPSKTKWVNPAP